jgi:hypothetical protein
MLDFPEMEVIVVSWIKIADICLTHSTLCESVESMQGKTVSVIWKNVYIKIKFRPAWWLLQFCLLGRQRSGTS